jgi:peptidyl-prolyl cis-trans isomerase D
MNDLLFYRQTEPGKVYRVISEFGIHLVEVMEKKADSVSMGVQLAFIREPIVPSESTQDYMYDDALEFAGQHRKLDALKSTVESRNDLVLEEARNLERSGYVVGTLPPGNTSREIVRWMFDPATEVNDVAPTVFVIEDDANYFNAQYVVVGLEAIHEKGLAKPASILEMIEGPVKNEKRGELIVSRITSPDLDAISQQFSVSVDTIQKATFGMFGLGNLGEEPEVLVGALKLEAGQRSAPIIGRNGVFVLEVLDKQQTETSQNVAQLRRQTTMQMANPVEFELMTSLKESASIKDNRYTFY